MKKFFLLVFLPFLLAGSFTLGSDFTVNEAEAARFGGGRSFGGSRSYRQPAPAPARQQAAPAQNGAMSRNAAPAAGMGGFFGPLLAGSMLGALFFGGGFHGFGMADAVVILLGVFLLNRFIRSRRRAAELAAQTADDSGAGYYDARGAGSGGEAWNRLRDNIGGAAGGKAQQEQAPGAEPGPRLPDGFDEREFLAGAKLMFTRMQEAWDQRDLADIAEFTTPPVLAEITRQAEEDPSPSRTDILLVNARLLEAGRVKAAEGPAGSRDSADAPETASVYFEVLMREQPGLESFEMREVWHFMRENGDTWKLYGIQQTA